jgi:hypothetical protein
VRYGLSAGDALGKEMKIMRIFVGFWERDEDDDNCGL